MSLFEDRFGNLWAGLNNGIAIIELTQPFTLINDGLELSGTGYTAFKKDSKLYLGTNNGLFILENLSKNNLSYSQYKKIPATEGQTYSLQMLDGDLILGHHQGAILINSEQASIIPNSAQGIWKIEALPNSKNTFIAGSYMGMYLLEKKNNTWKFSQKIKGFQESSRKFEIVDSTTIWVSHGYKGIYRLDFKDNFKKLVNTRFYGVKDGLPSNLLNNVFRIENRLIFTAEIGVYEYDNINDRFIQDSVLTEHFGNQHIREIEEDIKGNLYFITDDEVGVLKKNTVGEYEKESTIFQKIFPFVSDDLENITVIDPENVLINAKEGFIHYNPSLNKISTEDFRTVFRKISWADSILHGGYRLAKNDVKETSRSISLPFSKNSFHFYYSSVYYEGNFEAEYQYKLENFDNEWSKWSLSSEKEYTNLPSGNYTFQVRSRNSFGKLSSVDTFSFKISPPWYANNFAYIVYTLLILSIFSLGLFMQNRHQKKKRLSIVEDANKTILEKETELKEVTTNSEKEIAQLKNEHLEAEIKHKNHQLTSSAVHLINKNELMSNLKSEINQLLKEKDQQALNKGLKRVVKSIEKNIAEDDTWSQFEIHFDQVHGDFIKILRKSYPALTPQELKLAAFLRMNMSSKKIAHLLNISVRGVEISRYRLRKKLSIESHENLIEFMMNIS